MTWYPGIRSLCKFGFMKLIRVIALLLMGTACAGAHPLHLSITNITYENGMLKVSMKTFRNDWETAYFHYHSRVADFTDPEQREIPWFREYLWESFGISREEGGKSFLFKVRTIILDEESMTIEMEAEVPGNPKSLYIYNSLLTDIFPDQTNLVIFGHKNRETGIKFDVRTHDEVVMLN